MFDAAKRGHAPCLRLSFPLSADWNDSPSLAPVVFEDEQLLVVNKPAGWNTHSPSPFAGEGIFDWLRHREPRWEHLAIIHRLDKETSGVLVFGKTTLANRSLTQQFTDRVVSKTYLLLTDRPVPPEPLLIESAIVRSGDRYVSRPPHAGADLAQTRFKLLKPVRGSNHVSAEPLTGRTHQIRVHAAQAGFPILGDSLYGGAPADRVCLHAAEIALRHPATGDLLVFAAPEPFAEEPRLALREGFVDLQTTDAFRLSHGASEGCPGCYVDRLGDFLLVQSERPLTPEQLGTVQGWVRRFGSRGVCLKRLERQVRLTTTEGVSPQLLLGQEPSAEFVVKENGVRYALSCREGYSVGLFLDQRDNRRRLRVNHVAAGFPGPASPGARSEVLNVFAYTCGFSVCAALAGARVTSVDLSKKYLGWGRRNFALNGLDAEAHEFIAGDALDWLRRLAKKGRAFDAVLLDPPTFSTSKESGRFQAARDYGALVERAIPLVRAGGVLFASTNAATLAPERFLEMVERPIAAAGREVLQRHYAPQPPDFPVSRDEPAYLKTVWLRLS